VLKECFELFDRHGDGRILLFSIGYELDGLSFRLGVFGELLEPSSLYEHFDCIFQVDAVVGHVTVTFVESILFCFVDPFLFLWWSLWGLDPDVLQLRNRDFSKNFLPRH